MKPDNIVEYVRSEIVERLSHMYIEALDSEASNRQSDQWIKIVSAYQRLDSASKLALHGLIRQAMIDVSSKLLGLLDGTSSPYHFKEDFRLHYGNSSEKLNGDLQELFLAAVEDADGDSGSK